MLPLPYPEPPFRRLRGYSFDPSLSTSFDMALIDTTTYAVRWEKDLQPGPVGEYIEVIDYDPVGRAIYPPVNLNDPLVLAQDGLAPSEGSAQFHQQMVYAVAMTTIQNFEHVLGRKVLWAYRLPLNKDGKILAGKPNEYVQRLRIYPHAMREANAYYSPVKKALLFGYFLADSTNETTQLPGGLVFTCLSHDIVAHETTHAILDGMYRRFIEPSHPDTLAFHEAFSDLVALFQHFSYKDVLENQIAKTRGELQSQSLLGELAQEFGRAIGGHGSLRSAIGKINPKTNQWELLKPDPNDYRTVMEPHGRGAILVATVFDAFLLIYKQRASDLFRIATNGTGVLPEGALHPDLVNRLAAEAAKSARHILTMCIRALDYCPPADVTFGDFLRALITADLDLVYEDTHAYRTAFIEAFKRRGIYPDGLRTISVESLTYPKITPQLTPDLIQKLREIGNEYRGKLETDFDHLQDRRNTFAFIEKMKAAVHHELEDLFMQPDGLKLMHLMGLSEKIVYTNQTDAERFGKIRFQVESLRRARRTGPDGRTTNQLIVAITQAVNLLDNSPQALNDATDTTAPESQSTAKFRGGCSFIMDLDLLTVQYIIAKDINDNARRQRQQRYMTGGGANVRTAYYMQQIADDDDSHPTERFALLHRLEPTT
jgi:hypothetical protein